MRRSAQQKRVYEAVTDVVTRRTYDRALEGNHGGGYPRDFVEKARSLPCLKNVFENDDMLIFRFTAPEPTTRPTTQSATGPAT